MQNPIFYSNKADIAFAKIEASHLVAATEQIIATTKAGIEGLYRQTDTTAQIDTTTLDKTFDNTFAAYDRLLAAFSDVYGIIYLLANVSPEPSVYQQANEAILKLEAFANQLSLDENLYQALKMYSQLPQLQNLEAPQKKFVEDTIKDFERNGFALDAAKREQLGILKNKHAEISNAFLKNIAQSKGELIITEAQTAGLPQDYKARYRNQDGTYTITLDYPAYQPFMKYAQDDDLRKQLYFKYLNRASDQNPALLQEMLTLKKQIAQLLGYENYADYRLENSMAKKAALVWEFENELAQTVRQIAEKEFEKLNQIKLAHYEKNNPLSEAEKKEAQQPVKAWQSSFFTEKLLQSEYQVESQQVKQYFELQNVIYGIFSIIERLFEVRFVAQQNPHAIWHEDVQLFHLHTWAGSKIGTLYLDLYPRPNKYSHAACFGVVKGYEKANGERHLPITALVCNFPKPTQNQPSLLSHDLVETLFHEFGHGLHQLLSQTPLHAQAGTSVVRDFVEVPSQLFENWAWDYQTLSLFAKHYQTGEVLPLSLFEKMKKAKNVNIGLHTLQQILYGTYDMTLHHQYNPEEGNATQLGEIFKKLQARITFYQPLEGTHFEAAFGHLTNYAAAYYGYLWSLVFADDVFSVFEKEGLLNPQIGKKYQQTLLSRGGSQEAELLLENFLGRKPNKEAFLKTLKSL
ncbi:M3 family metallopeptidase [Hugenholtzia roseola]|uniref:M3 family metallopeptidase n=1 Tax=Hugenholtzia roseola TaxID=1002 RepID=UPI000410C5DD|nr:M3 family metallopeptidase [Hugenholtzia roseola]